MADGTATWLGETSGRLSTAARAHAVEAVALAALLVLATWIFTIPLHTMTNYDEGNYLAALADLRHGFALGKDVYADQPPGWYLLLQLLGWIFGDTVTGIRTGMLCLSLLGVVAAWACGRRYGPLPALGAAALLVVAPPYPLQATQIGADTPAAVLALCALAFAVWAYRGRGSVPLAVAAGATLVFAISVKLFAVTALLPFVAVAWPPRRLWLWSLLGAAGVVGVEVLLYRNELSQIAHDAFGQHVTALGNASRSSQSNLHRLVHFLDWHTPFAWLVLAGLVVSVWLTARGRRTSLLWKLWLFVPAAAVFIRGMNPLLDHHFVILAVSIAVPTGVALGLGVAALRVEARVGLALFAVVFVAAGVVQQRRHLHRSTQPEPAWIFHASNWLRENSRPGEVVATDIPILAFYADRPLVPDFVDTSFTRAGTGELTPKTVFAQMDRYHVRAAALGRVFWVDPQIRAAFDARFRRRTLAPNIVLYLGRRRP